MENKTLRMVIAKNRKNWLEQQGMGAHDLEVQNLIGNLDEAVVGYEARWGVMRLPELVGPDMAAKWTRQFDKLCAAIEANALVALRDLVPGTIRAYAAMEADVKARGCQPYDPVFWEVELADGKRVRIVKSHGDAAMVAKEGHATFSLPEIAEILSQQSLVTVLEAKRVFPGAVVEKVVFDDKGGDEIPW